MPTTPTIWIPSHDGLVDHPKTLAVARRLGICPVQVVGHLHCLWWWVMRHRGTGNITGVADEDLAVAARYDGSAPDFVAALLQCGGGDGKPGFIERTKRDQIVIHDWRSYGGKLADKRAGARARQAKSRSPKAGSHAPERVTSRGSHAHVTPQDKDKEKEKDLGEISPLGPPPLTASDAAIGDLADHYRERFIALTGRQPRMSPLDDRALVALTEEHGADEVKRVLELYFAADWWRKRGWPLRELSKAWNELLAQSTSKLAHKPPREKDYSGVLCADGTMRLPD
ncbi:MAG: hypothetical protein A2Y78_08920 [Acidobacteria bacterium RBG_13_68_16]|nr:MAG: hypothetical protein A2Y78_08920 [Acidobacteria bacterium RBG_13_68_16]